MFRPFGARASPDQGPIHPDALEPELLVQRDRRQVEIVHEERDRLSLPGAVTADLAQERARVAAAAETGIRPDAHELHGLVGDRRVLALRGDRAVDHADHGALLFYQLADALPIAGGVAVEWIDAHLLAMHGRAGGDERLEVAHGRVAR